MKLNITKEWLEAEISKEENLRSQGWTGEIGVGNKSLSDVLHILELQEMAKNKKKTPAGEHQNKFSSEKGKLKSKNMNNKKKKDR